MPPRGALRGTMLKDEPQRLIVDYFGVLESIENVTARSAQGSAHLPSSSADLDKLRQRYLNSLKGEVHEDLTRTRLDEMHQGRMTELKERSAELEKKILVLDPRIRSMACSELHGAGEESGRMLIPEGIDESYWKSARTKVVAQPSAAPEGETARTEQLSVAELLRPYLKGHKRLAANEERARGILQKVSPEAVTSAITELSQACPSAELRDAILAANPALFIDRQRAPEAFRAYVRCLELIAPRLVTSLDAGRSISVDQIASVDGIERWLEAEAKREAFLADKATIERTLAQLGIEEPSVALAVLRKGCLIKGVYAPVSEQFFGKNAEKDVGGAACRRRIAEIRDELIKAGLLLGGGRGHGITLATDGEPRVMRVLQWVRANLPASDPS